MTNDISNLSLQQLKRAVAIREQIEILQGELSKVLGNSGTQHASNGARKLSAATRAKMSAAAKARSGKRSAPSVSKPKRKLSAAGRKRLSESAKKRWAKVRAAGGKALGK